MSETICWLRRSKLFCNKSDAPYKTVLYASQLRTCTLQFVLLVSIEGPQHTLSLLTICISHFRGLILSLVYCNCLQYPHHRIVVSTARNSPFRVDVRIASATLSLNLQFGLGLQILFHLGRLLAKWIYSTAVHCCRVWDVCGVGGVCIWPCVLNVVEGNSLFYCIMALQPTAPGGQEGRHGLDGCPDPAGCRPVSSELNQANSPAVSGH